MMITVLLLLLLLLHVTVIIRSFKSRCWRFGGQVNNNANGGDANCVNWHRSSRSVNVISKNPGDPSPNATQTTNPGHICHFHGTRWHLCSSIFNSIALGFPTAAKKVAWQSCKMTWDTANQCTIITARILFGGFTGQSFEVKMENTPSWTENTPSLNSQSLCIYCISLWPAGSFEYKWTSG